MASVLPKLRALGDRLRSRLGLDGGSSDTTVAVDTKDAKTSDACGAESCCRVDTGDAKNSAGCCRADDDSESQKRATVTGGKILYGSQTGTARRLAHKLANGPTLAYATMKKNIATALDGTITEVLLAEAEGQRLAGASKDAMEGGMAFLQKRKPDFKGE